MHSHSVTETNSAQQINSQNNGLKGSNAQFCLLQQGHRNIILQQYESRVARRPVVAGTSRFE